ncbi:TPA: hypothetical protein RCG91_004255 [Enterobacter roggenkampii]|nr:hypothetical protein [Enterobacter roggenkampii]
MKFTPILLLLLIMKCSYAGVPVVNSIVRDASCDESTFQGAYYCYDVNWSFVPRDAGDKLPPQTGLPVFTGYARLYDKNNPSFPINMIWKYSMDGVKLENASWNTLIEEFKKQWGSSGTVRLKTMAPSNGNGQVCFVFGVKDASSANDAMEPIAIPSGQQKFCSNIDPSPSSCKVTSDDIVLDYGNVISDDVQDLKKASTIVFQCNAPSIAKISAIGLTNGRLNMGAGINANIMVDGKNIANGVDVNIKKSVLSVAIESILNADDKILKPGIFSASLVIKTDFY